MPTQHPKHVLETFVFESPNTIMLAVWNALSSWMSETIPSTIPQRHERITQTVRDVSERADTLIRRACDEQGSCKTVGYRRSAYAADHARPDGIDAQDLTQSIVHALRQRSREEAIDYLATLITRWCLACPASLAQPYLVDGQAPTDIGIARSLLMWTFRPLDFWN
jgi:hypothetical protein